MKYGIIVSIVLLGVSSVGYSLPKDVQEIKDLKAYCKNNPASIYCNALDKATSGGSGKVIGKSPSPVTTPVPVYTQPTKK